MAKAHRLDADPSNFVLTEEVYKDWKGSETKKDIQEKVTSRVLDDSERVFEVQNLWKTPGRFTLRERDEVKKAWIFSLRSSTSKICSTLEK